MENLLLAPVLFLIYFCFICCLFYNPKPSATSNFSAPIHSESSSNSTDGLFSKNASQPRSTAPTLADYRAAFETEPESLSECESLLTPGNEQIELLSIDLEKLQLRPARKIASQLGILQKVNGKDQPLAWLGAQIGKKLAEQPQDVIPLVREMLEAA